LCLRFRLHFQIKSQLRRLKIVHFRACYEELLSNDYLTCFKNVTLLAGVEISFVISVSYRKDRQAYFSLQARCKELRDKISVLDAKCSVEMVKRFGENVTMTDIESFAVNRTLEEMKEIARRKEQSLYKTIKSGQVYIVFILLI